MSIGYVHEELDLRGLSSIDLKVLLEVDVKASEEVAEELQAYFKLFGSRMLQELLKELEELRERLLRGS